MASLGSSVRLFARRAAAAPLARRHLIASRRICSSVAPPGSSTAAVHADALVDPLVAWTTSTGQDVSPPLSLSTTFTCPEPGEGGHIYSRITNPTRERAEVLLAAVESTPTAPAHAILYASGLAATFGALSRLLPQRVAISGGYHGTHLVLQQLQRISGGSRCGTACHGTVGNRGEGT